MDPCRPSSPLPLTDGPLAPIRPEASECGSLDLWLSPSDRGPKIWSIPSSGNGRAGSRRAKIAPGDTLQSGCHLDPRTDSILANRRSEITGWAARVCTTGSQGGTERHDTRGGSLHDHR